MPQTSLPGGLPAAPQLCGLFRLILTPNRSQALSENPLARSNTSPKRQRGPLASRFPRLRFGLVCGFPTTPRLPVQMPVSDPCCQRPRDMPQFPEKPATLHRRKNRHNPDKLQSLYPKPRHPKVNHSVGCSAIPPKEVGIGRGPTAGRTRGCLAGQGQGGEPQDRLSPDPVGPGFCPRGLVSIPRPFNRRGKIPAAVGVAQPSGAGHSIRKWLARRECRYLCWANSQSSTPGSWRNVLPTCQWSRFG